MRSDGSCEGVPRAPRGNRQRPSTPRALGPGTRLLWDTALHRWRCPEHMPSPHVGGLGPSRALASGAWPAAARLWVVCLRRWPSAAPHTVAHASARPPGAAPSSNPTPPPQWPKRGPARVRGFGGPAGALSRPARSRGSRPSARPALWGLAPQPQACREGHAALPQAESGRPPHRPSTRRSVCPTGPAVATAPVRLATPAAAG
jgi:hypothetical protein